MPAANRKLVRDITAIGQQSLEKIRQAADLADNHLADAVNTKRDDFDLDTQYVRPQSLGAPAPAGVTEVTAVTAVTTATAQITIMTHSKYYGCGSGGRHCKL